MRILRNTKDNKWLQETLQWIYSAFVSMLREELNQISVKDLCEAADIECIPSMQIMGIFPVL